MANFRFVPNHNQNGKIVYNEGIVKNIVALAVSEVEGTMLASEKKRGITLYFEKDGIYADISVIVKYGYNIPELAYRIQQAVKQNVENMTHYKMANVDVHIQNVVFDENNKNETQDDKKELDDNTEEPIKKKSNNKAEETNELTSSR